MQQEKVTFTCPVEATLSLIGGKYKPIILWHLIKQPLHYMELQRLIPNATSKMLSQQPVSYTHLDVYKRQDIDTAPICTLPTIWPTKTESIKL